MGLVFFLALLPIIADGLQEGLLLLGEFTAALVGIPVFLRGGEEFEEVLFHLF